MLIQCQKELQKTTVNWLTGGSCCGSTKVLYAYRIQMTVFELPQKVFQSEQRINWFN